MRSVQKSITIPIAIAITIFLGMGELFIAYLFPRFDIGGFFLYLFLLIGFPIGIGITGWVILSHTKNKIKASLFTIVILIGAFLAQLSLHPSFTNPWVEIYDYSVAFWKYPNNINYEDLAFGNEQKIVAASVKYHNSLPEKILKITIEDESFNVIEQYWAELKDNSISYDESKFLLTTSDNTLLLITNPDSFIRREYNLRTR